jgi:16S rRNA (guanine1207-N2)-methyltransferase
MSNVSHALLHAFDTANISAASPCLLLMPGDVQLASRFPDAVVWHPQADQASIWSHRGHRVLHELAADEKFKTVILCCPKQKDETLYLMAKGLSFLEKDGILLASADNLAGGKTLEKLLWSLAPDVDHLSKHKCRVVWTTGLHRLDRSAIDEAIAKGSMRLRDDGFETQPGLFSWSHLDKGTDVLLHHLPFSFAGLGADFGCGVGILGARLLQRHSDITKLYCIDNDSRAVACTRKNLEKWQSRCDVMWADIRKLPHIPPLDFIVMNPPFHQGKMDSNLLGQNFITTAAAHLKTGGMLVFVANVHLPYEAILHQHFSMQRLVMEQDGFKVIEAIK